MKVIELFTLWVASSQKILTDLASRRLNAAIDLFKAVKKAVELVDGNELEKGQRVGDFFTQVAERVMESPQKINKLRNIAHLTASRYKEYVQLTSAQMVLDLGQDSRLADSIKDYKVGFIMDNVIGAYEDNVSANGGYKLSQNDTERFMTLLKGSLKEADTTDKREGFNGDFHNDFYYLAKHFGSLCQLCVRVGKGTLFTDPYFTATDLLAKWDAVEEKDDKEPEKKNETIDLDDHKNALKDNNDAHNEKNKELTTSNTTLQEKVQELSKANAGYIEKIAKLNNRIKELESDNAVMAKSLIESAEQLKGLRADTVA